MSGPFLLDSNFFIQAHRMHYPIDVVPGLWNRVIDLANSDLVISIDKVNAELAAGKDDLHSWCVANLSPTFFHDTRFVIAEYMDLTHWAASKAAHYTQGALAEFLDVNEADAWLVAYAKANNNIIVTHEVSDLQSRKRIKIPDAGFVPVECVTTIEMFRRLGRTF
jgi:hypothetical protein